MRSEDTRIGVRDSLELVCLAAKSQPKFNIRVILIDWNITYMSIIENLKSILCDTVFILFYGGGGQDVMVQQESDKFVQNKSAQFR